jgi:signal peptidase I
VTETTRPADSPRRTRWQRARGSLLLRLLAVLLVLVLVQMFLGRLYSVPSGSMERTLAVGDRVVVDRLGHALGEPGRQDVIVFAGAEGWGAQSRDSLPAPERAVRWLSEVTGIGPGFGDSTVKRVIGLPGETVSCCDDAGAVTVDGAPLDEPYIHEDLPFVPGAMDCSTVPASPRCFGEARLGEGEYLVLGDHRGNSQDSVSACRGDAGPCDARTVEEDAVVGQARAIVWPVPRWGMVG